MSALGFPFSPSSSTSTTSTFASNGSATAAGSSTLAQSRDAEMIAVPLRTTLVSGAAGLLEDRPTINGLRHRLARSGHIVCADELPVAQLQDVDDPQADRHSAGASVGEDVPNHHDVIARINELLDVDPEIPKLLDQLLRQEAVSCDIAPAVSRRMRCSRLRVERREPRSRC
jgi:hypothetical protein